MKHFDFKHSTWLGGAAAALLLAGTATAFAQTAITPHSRDVGGDCTSGNGKTMAQCQNTISNQQNDATVGNGPNAAAAPHVNGIGANNNFGGSNVSSGANAANPTGSGDTGTVGGNGPNPASGTTGQNSATGTVGGNGTNPANGTGSSGTGTS